MAPADDVVHLAHTDELIAGPFPMLVLQSVTFLLGLYALLTHVTSRRAAAIAAVVVLLSPQNIHVMAVIWKDSLMAGFLLAAIAALLSDQRRWRVVGYGLLFLATAVRYNAAAPTFPIVLVLWDRAGALPPVKRYASAVAVWLALTTGAFVVNGVIVETKIHPWAIGAAPVDIAGTLHFADDVDLAQLVRETPEAPWKTRPEELSELLARGYSPRNSYIQVFEGENAFLHYPQTVQQREAISALWRKVVPANPMAFLEHRLAVFKAQLKGGVTVWHSFSYGDEWREHLRLGATYSQVQLWWAQKVERLARKRLFRPHMYFVLALVLLLFTRRQRLAFMVLASGICHELGLFVLAPAIDYRYSHWMVIATLIGGIILFVRRRAERRIDSAT